MAIPRMCVWLVGAFHDAMWSGAREGMNTRRDIQEFRDYLIDCGRRYTVDLVAEEFSEEAASGSNAQRVTAKDAAVRLGVPHLYCDPASKERDRLGIPKQPKESNHRMREAEWLKRLEEARAEGVLFVCGDGHVDSFARRLRDAGHCVAVVGRDKGKNVQCHRALDL